MQYFVVISLVACLGAAVPAGLLGEPGAIYGRLQRNSYVPYPKPDYTRLYLALKNARLADEAAQDAQAYDYEQRGEPLGAIFEPQNEAFEYDDTQDGMPINPNQQWLDIGTLYDTPVDEEGLEQQKELVRQIMSNYIEKKSSHKKVLAPSTTVKPTLKASTPSSTTTTSKPQQKEDRIPKVSKIHGQKEYAMLRPAGTADSRRALPELWPEDAEVQQLKRTARRPASSRKSGAIDQLTAELEKLRH